MCFQRMSRSDVWLIGAMVLEVLLVEMKTDEAMTSGRDRARLP